ncbi:MAG: hypothetical protein LAO20_14890 [Acidobacteriia bacterium]|nr:hypothetical protein [Terriglobia bacterium]
MSKRLCIFGTHHEFQVDSPMDARFNQFLRALIADHKVDTILEEASGLPPKSCVELLADGLSIRWANMDLTAEERKLIPDAALKSVYCDTFQDLSLHTLREKAWVEKIISDTKLNSGLLIVGLCHVFSFSEKLLKLGFEVEVHAYSPNRIFNWSGRPRISV